MPVPTEIEDIPGASELHDWFGAWPDFHDAEIISVCLNREGNSSLRVHTWEMTDQTDNKGSYVLANHVVVEFNFEAVFGLILNGLNHQNVINGLAVKKTDSGFSLMLHDCYGLSGSIEAEKIFIRLVPGKPL